MEVNYEGKLYGNLMSANARNIKTTRNKSANSTEKETVRTKPCRKRENKRIDCSNFMDEKSDHLQERRKRGGRT